jgi:hypothetical protein
MPLSGEAFDRFPALKSISTAAGTTPAAFLLADHRKLPFRGLFLQLFNIGTVK